MEPSAPTHEWTDEQKTPKGQPAPPPYYDNANMGYPQAGPGYPQAGPGYPQAGPGYPQAGPGYPQAGQGYPQAGPGYPQAGPGYPQAGPGYPQAGQGYPQAGRGYPQAGQGYPQAGPGYPPQTQGYGGQPGVAVQDVVYVTQGQLASPVDDYLCYSIFTMLCCCLPLGIAALIYSISTRAAKANGDQLKAEQNSKTARSLNHVALGLGLCFIIAIVVFFVVLSTT